jgi:signal transduction histidine kinase
MLEIVWDNLLSNAFKFTEPGGAVTLTQTSDEDAVTVAVADTGCGMDAKTLNRVFDKFYQGDSSHSQEGNGLGLALVLRVVEILGGEISAKSAPGEGSVFTVRLKTEP